MTTREITLDRLALRIYATEMDCLDGVMVTIWLNGECQSAAICGDWLDVQCRCAAIISQYSIDSAVSIG